MKSIVSYLLAASMVLPTAAQAAAPLMEGNSPESPSVSTTENDSLTNENGSANTENGSVAEDNNSVTEENTASKEENSSTSSENTSTNDKNSSENDKSSSVNNENNSANNNNNPSHSSSAANDEESSNSNSSSSPSSSSVKSESSDSKNHNSAPSSNSNASGSLDVASSSANMEMITDRMEEEKQEEPVAEEEPEVVAQSIKSRIELNLNRALPLEKDLQAKVTLSKDGAVITEQQMVLKADQSKTALLFEELEEGTYTVTIQAQGFELWQQNVVLNAQEAVKLEVYTGYLSGHDYKKEALHPGALNIGDANGDGTISEQDTNALIDAIAAGSKDSSLDFNGDEFVDLLDLQYLANTMDNTAMYEDNTATAQTRVISLGTVGTGTEIVSGNLHDLVNEEGANVQLQPKNGTAINQDNPVEVTFGFSSEENASTELQNIEIQTSKENPVTEGYFTVTYANENGEEVKEDIFLSSAIMQARSGVTATVDENGLVKVDFNGQIAVKKVTFVITGTKNNTNLAEISKVDFVNGMENRIPEVEMNIPKNLAGTVASKEFLLTWDEQVNVTGYEVEISQNGVTETRMTSTNQLKVTSFAEDDLVNYTDYVVRVQSVNGDWKSGYSEPITVRPLATEVPHAPDNVHVEGAYRALNVSWKKMKDTNSYSVFYRPYEQGDYIQVATDIKENRFTIPDLEVGTKYQVYIVGKNEVGESRPSLVAVGETLTLNPVKMPEYKLINTSNGEGKVSNHIKNVELRRSPSVAQMVNSPLDTTDRTALGVVDNDENSYYRVKDWDDGYSYQDRNGKGLMFVFDEPQSLGSIRFSEPTDRASINQLIVEYYDLQEKQYKRLNNRWTRVKGENGRYFYVIKWDGEIKTDQIYIATAGHDPLQIAEAKFYAYDSISDDINALFDDAYHTVLKKEVNEDTIKGLEERLNIPDSVSGELHPDRDILQKELDNARSILNTESLSEIFSVKNTITAHGDNGYGFGGLNAWQPLGVVASEGDKLVVYVGAEGKKIGENAELRLVATQYHSEASAVSADLGQLKIGRNEIDIRGTNAIDTEHGGALYIQYTGKSGGTNYGVRVSGGTKVPVLDLYGITNKDERIARAKQYIEALQQYVPTIPELHTQMQHTHAYDEKNCVLGATDMLLDEMMISIPAPQVLKGLKGSTVDEKAVSLEKSMTAMDDMMKLFYQHKGLNDNSPSSKLPSQHLNIRYQRMFGGAFMYASGNHIGIEWNETMGMVRGEPVVADEMGRYVSGQYFGWGIGHEIGHNINQNTYAVAEVTNNYFAQLAQAKESSSSVRFNYDNVYEKVTSNTVGNSSNVFTQLGLYWQLHLAYDNYYNFKTFDNYKEQMDNLFFARVDSYSRKPETAPAPSGVKLTLTNSKDQNLMRLATAAAQKDLTDFFVRWGKTPDAQTRAYAAQFAKEERAIYYVNDDARTWRIENKNNPGFGGQNVLTDATTVSVVGNEVTLNLKNNLSDQGALLGYEITRVMTSDGHEVRQVVGFTRENTFVDHVTNVNNRVIRYEVTAIDQKLNRSAVYKLNPVKISHEGNYDKTLWTVSTNMLSEQDTMPSPDEHDPCAPELESAISQVIDNDATTVYTGSAKGEAWVQLNFNKTLAATGLKYRAGKDNAIQSYEIEISTNGKDWKSIAQGEFPQGQETSTIYFRNENNDPWIATYDAAYLRLKVKGQNGQNISIAELDVLGPTGDNVDWRTDSEGNQTVGILKENYVYDSANGDMIPKDSLVFIGQYKGNPAYNVVMLFDENGDIVGGTNEAGELVAHQIIMADVPEHGELGETTDGSWIYWIEPTPESGFGTLPKTVRTELYRVDNALTNGGQRMVSDSFALTMPEKLPEIVLK